MTTPAEPGPLRFGVVIPNQTDDRGSVSRDAMFGFVERAEALGFDSLWTIEHFFSAYPSYRESRFDPLLTLMAAAARTERITLGTCVYLLPLRNPVHVAKDVATLDHLCSGRLLFGVGIGWNPREFEVSGVPLSERGRRIDEGIRLLKRLLTETEVTFEGRYYRTDAVTIEPRPHRPGGPPILYGGGTIDRSLYPADYPESTAGWRLERVLERIGRIADGIVTSYRSFPVTSAAGAERDWETICGHALRHGRDPARLDRVHLCHFHIDRHAGPDLASARRAVERFTYSGFDEVRRMYALGAPADVAAVIGNWIRTSGIRHFVLNPIDDHQNQIALLATEVLPRLREA